MSAPKPIVVTTKKLGSATPFAWDSSACRGLLRFLGISEIEDLTGFDLNITRDVGSITLWSYHNSVKSVKYFRTADGSLVQPIDWMPLLELLGLGSELIVTLSLRIHAKILPELEVVCVPQYEGDWSVLQPTYTVV